MLENIPLREKRDRRVNVVNPNALKRTLEGVGYFPEANIIPPFLSIEAGPLDNTSRANATPVTMFVPKSNQQWRDFKIIRPENYTNTVDLIVNNYDIFKELYKASKSIYSYSTPQIFSSQARRTGKQISSWHKSQEALLFVSSEKRLPILLQLDIQSCYHTMYTHALEWAFESVDKKRLGKKLDESIRSGNERRTHGIAVGPYISDILAEAVLCHVDSKVESHLANIECTGFRYKDNYYLLCKSKNDADVVLSAIASELRGSNFVINDSKTVISDFASYYSARWQSDYVLLLESLSLDDKHPVFTNRKLKVFVEQVINLSNRYNHGKSILERAIALITIATFEGRIDYRWLFYSVANMLPLRSYSYPKLLAYLKKISEENAGLLKPVYEDFVLNEIDKANEREDLFTIMWVVYALYDSDNAGLRSYASNVLAVYRSQNKLADELIKFMENTPDEPVLWEDNKSRLEFKHGAYMKAPELHDYLGVSFGES